VYERLRPPGIEAALQESWVAPAVVEEDCRRRVEMREIANEIRDGVAPLMDKASEQVGHHDRMSDAQSIVAFT
jgi:hypothetical protein